MARRALLVGINEYEREPGLRGCINDVSNIRDLLRTYLGFRNEDIRVLVNRRATRQNIIHRLRLMVNLARPGDFMIFYFAGHGSQVRDRNGDELSDGMDEILCPTDMSWDGRFIRDDDLDRIFRPLSTINNVLLEVILDCCNSGTGTRSVGSSPVDPACQPREVREVRYLPPPYDIVARYEGEISTLGETRGFRSVNRSTMNHILWAASREDQLAADAPIDGTVHGVFTYYFCKHFRQDGGRITRADLLERVRNSLRYHHFFQEPQLETGDPALINGYPLQFPAFVDDRERLLYLSTPYMRGDDVRRVQEALAGAGYDILPDGVFGPHTRRIVMAFQRDRGLTVDGVVGEGVRAALFG